MCLPAETVYIATSRRPDGGLGLFSRVALSNGTVFIDVAFGVADVTTTLVASMSNDVIMPDVHSWLALSTADALAEMHEYEHLSSLFTNCVMDFIEDPSPPGGEPRAPLRVQMRALQHIAAGSELLRSYGALSWLAIGGSSFDAGPVDALAAAFLAATAHKRVDEYLWNIARFANQAAVDSSKPLPPQHNRVPRDKAAIAQLRRKLKKESTAEEIKAYLFQGVGPLADLDAEEDALGK